MFLMPLKRRHFYMHIYLKAGLIISHMYWLCLSLDISSFSRYGTRLICWSKEMLVYLIMDLKGSIKLIYFLFIDNKLLTVRIQTLMWDGLEMLICSCIIDPLQF